MAGAQGDCVMGAPVLVAGSAFLISARGLFGFMPLQWTGAGFSPRRATHFLLLRQKKVSKEKATPLSASLRFASGNLRCSRPAGSRSNSLRCASLRQSRALIRWPLRSSAHTEGMGSRTSKQPLGPLLRSALCCGCKRLAQGAAFLGSSAATTRMAVWVFTPCWLRLRRGGCGVARASERACFVI